LELRQGKAPLMAGLFCWWVDWRIVFGGLPEKEMKVPAKAGKLSTPIATLWSLRRKSSVGLGRPFGAC
jgi:hypothetical protein